MIENVKTLDDLFKKTQAKPPIYYLPHSDEELARRQKEKEEAEKKAREEKEAKERERERERSEREKERARGRSRSTSRSRSRSRSSSRSSSSSRSRSVFFLSAPSHCGSHSLCACVLISLLTFAEQ